MSKFNQDDARAVMNDVTKIRNVAMLSTGGGGKTVLLDNLGAKCGFLSEDKIGDSLFMLYRKDEREKKSTLKANPCHMVIDNVKYQDTKELTKEGKRVFTEEKTGKFLFGMVDTPGHIDFSPEFIAACRLCDSTLSIVGANDGMSVMLEYMVADSLRERHALTLMINKLDISILTLDRSSEEIYNDLYNIITSYNVACHVSEKLGIKDACADPQVGNVIFGSALYGWGFNLKQWAAMYAKKMPGMDEEKMLGRLWGDNFFNAKKKTWTKVEVDDSKRAFCQFVMDPIINMHKAIMAGDAKWETMADKLGIELTPADKKLEGKPLLKKVMSRWMPLGDLVCSTLATHTDNPKVSQERRVEHIYKGDIDTDLGKAMKACDPAGPLMVQIVKMTGTGSAGRFYCIGRMFSGTIKADKYAVRNPDWDPEDPETSGCTQDARVQAVNLCLGSNCVSVLDVPCGNIIAVTGVDTCIGKSATITTDKKAYNFENLRFSVSTVYKVSIKPANNKELPKLVEGLRRLIKGDILVSSEAEAGTGDHIVSTCGSEHQRLVIKDLREEYACVDIIQGLPTVNYKETVTGETPKPALSKSPNKHNRLYVMGCALEEEFCKAVEARVLNMQQDVKKRARIMIDEHGWEKTDCMKLWSFGPNDISEGGANCIVDQTKGIQYMNEIKETVNSGFNWAARQGPLAEENMRGCRFNLMDVKMHADSIHRGMGQIQPTARRVCFGAVLTADARFMEPVFEVIIGCPEDQESGVSQALMAKRGEPQHSTSEGGKSTITAHLPIAETIGDDSFATVLQNKTSGKALATYKFSHWMLVPSDPLEKGSKAEGIMLNIRERKGLKVCQPDLGDYIDRL